MAAAVRGGIVMIVTIVTWCIVTHCSAAGTPAAGVEVLMTNLHCSRQLQPRCRGLQCPGGRSTVGPRALRCTQQPPWPSPCCCCSTRPPPPTSCSGPASGSSTSSPSSTGECDSSSYNRQIMGVKAAISWARVAPGRSRWSRWSRCPVHLLWLHFTLASPPPGPGLINNGARPGHKGHHGHPHTETRNKCKIIDYRPFGTGTCKRSGWDPIISFMIRVSPGPVSLFLHTDNIMLNGHHCHWRGISSQE